jgi:hypothetical protein
MTGLVVGTKKLLGMTNFNRSKMAVEPWEKWG